MTRLPCRSAAIVLTLLGLLAGPPAASIATADDLATRLERMARIRSASSPSFSPDGEQLAFVSDLTGVPQVWTVAATGGWPRLITDLSDQVGSVAWSPAGNWLAFTVSPGGALNQQVYLVRPDGTELTRVTDGGHNSTFLIGWSDDGTQLLVAGNRDHPAAFRAQVYDLAAAAFRPLGPASDAVYELPTDLAADHHRAVVARMKNRGDNNLFLVEGERELLLTPHQGPGSFSGGEFAPDGRTVYLASNQGRDLIAFARVRLGADGTASPIEVLAARDDAELQEFALSPDGTTAALLWNAAGRSELAFADLATGRVHPGPPLPAETAASPKFSRDGRRLALELSGATRPRDVWVLERTSGELRQVTHSPHPGIDLGTLATPELVRFPAADGLELSGWLYRPPAASAPAAYVLSFHGGPEAQERPIFRSEYQALLSRGIGVLAPNVRGSSGFGKRFVNLDNGALRHDGIRDLETCARWIAASGVGDPKRLGIMGGSYGGYMTVAGLAWYPELFAAGANLFGMVNFETFFTHTEPYIAAASTIEYGDPATQTQLLRELSPIHRLQHIRAPTLVLHGANDTNVPVVEAEQVVASLRQRGVPVDYVLFADEGHGFRKTANRLTATVAVVRWFERYLLAPAP